MRIRNTSTERRQLPTLHVELDPDEEAEVALELDDQGSPIVPDGFVIVPPDPGAPARGRRRAEPPQEPESE